MSGDVVCVFSLDALRDISQAWASTRSPDTSSDDDFIDETVGDSSTDQLTGSSGADLFIINMGDVITDFKFGTSQTNKDGDVVIIDGVVMT